MSKGLIQLLDRRRISTELCDELLRGMPCQDANGQKSVEEVRQSRSPMWGGQEKNRAHLLHDVPVILITLSLDICLYEESGIRVVLHQI